MLIEKFPSGPIATNAILFACTDTGKGAVIDPAPQSTEPILREAERKGVVIEKILLTHSHWDHIADVQELKRKTGAPVYIHPLDAPNLEVPGSDQLPLFFPIDGVIPDYLLEEGQILTVGELKVHVIHTPGHSPGGVCFYLPEENVLFSGDTLFKGNIGALHFPTGNPPAMWSSLKKLAVLPPQTRVIPGHGPDTTIEQETDRFGEEDL